MSAPSDTARPPGKVRPFYWSVRRELWENRAIYIGPLAIAAVVLAGFVLSAHALPRVVLHAAAPGGARAVQALNMPYAVAAAAPVLISFVVAVFYSLGALHGERRDRSLLFWKSLPVSDVTAVLAKAAVPLAVIPLVSLVVAIATQLAILAWSVLVLLLNGVDPALLWSQLKLPMFWVLLPYGLLVNALWGVPVYTWLLLVSAWARRMTFVWAVAPWLGLSLFEFLAFRTKHVWRFLDDRIFGGMAHAYTVGGRGEAPLSRLSQIDPLRVLSAPGLWIGLLIGAAFLAACIWLRRRQEPI